MAITRSATAPTAPPTIALVSELLLPGDDAVGRFEAVIVVVVAWTPVTGGVWVVLPVGEGEEALEAPINSPGPISGLPPADIDLFSFHVFSTVTSRVAQ